MKNFYLQQAQKFKPKFIIPLSNQFINILKILVSNETICIILVDELVHLLFLIIGFYGFGQSCRLVQSKIRFQKVYLHRLLISGEKKCFSFKRNCVHSRGMYGTPIGVNSILKNIEQLKILIVFLLLIQNELSQKVKTEISSG